MSEPHPVDHASQPAASAPMTTKPAKEEGVVKGASKAYLQGAAKEAGVKTLDYEKQHGSQQLDDAKAKAQGMWQKYCGCLGS